MIRFLADENFNRHIVKGLLLRRKTLDIVRAQDADLSGVDDNTLLAWAADDARVLLTHDVATIPEAAFRKIERGERMAGVLVVR